MNNEQISKSKQPNDEIDLIELFNKIGGGVKNKILWLYDKFTDLLILLIRKSLWISGFSIIGIIVGIIFYSISPRFYSSEMTALSNTLNNNYIISSINLLNDLFKDKNYIIAANYLEIPLQDAQQIKSIGAYYGIDVNKDGLIDFVDYKEKYDPTDTSINRSSSFFYVKLEVFSETTFSQARDGLKKYINKNNFIIENNRIRISQSELLIKTIDLEIKKLDSLQKIQYFEVPRTQRASTNQMVVLNEKEMKLYHEQILSLEKQKLQLEKDITLNKEPITVIQDFTPLSKAENPLSKYIIKWFLLFAVLGFIVSFLWQYRGQILKLIKEKHY